MGNVLRPASVVAWYVYGLRAESKGEAASAYKYFMHPITFVRLPCDYHHAILNT